MKRITTFKSKAAVFCEIIVALSAASSASASLIVTNADRQGGLWCITRRR